MNRNTKKYLYSWFRVFFRMSSISTKWNLEFGSWNLSSWVFLRGFTTKYKGLIEGDYKPSYSVNIKRE
jgi:hypothetical protein